MSNPLELELRAVVNEMAKDDQLSSHPSQIHCFEYVYHNVYSIYELQNEWRSQSCETRYHYLIEPVTRPTGQPQHKTTAAETNDPCPEERLRAQGKLEHKGQAQQSLGQQTLRPVQQPGAGMEHEPSHPS